MKVLVVEDDIKVARFLVRVLTEEGYAVDVCGQVSDAVVQVGSGVYDLVVLDWMLPDGDGLSVCRAARRGGSTVPVLMLTARGEVRERVLGLDAGADDYMTKPFEVEELLARVRALVRRSGGFAEVACGDLRIDRLHRRAVLGGRALDLTAREYALLLHLAHHADRTVSRTDLLTRVWDTHFDTSSNLVEVHISRLRDKLGEYAWMVETVRGVGYRLRARDPQAGG